ncbi:MAG: hypothetical protein M3548_19930 [Actinomycetota bacterium]|nr:hypothetical protein [Actinomycetota bacterium]
MTTSDESTTAGDELRQAAAAALADVNALDAMGDDRKIILKAIVEARLSFLAPTTAPSSKGGQPDGTSGDAILQGVAANGSLLDRIGSALTVDRDTLELVYSVENEEPTVVVSAKRLSSNKALATRQLGQLVVAARQIGGIEEWTSGSIIRPVVQQYGRLDTNNFAATIQQMDDVCVIRGRGQGRELKLTKPGIEKTADLIKKITDTDS